MSITQAVMYETSEANKRKTQVNVTDFGTSGKLHINVITFTTIIMLIPTLVPHCHSNIVPFHWHQISNAIIVSRCTFKANVICGYPIAMRKSALVPWFLYQCLLWFLNIHTSTVRGANTKIAMPSRFPKMLFRVRQLPSHCRPLYNHCNAIQTLHANPVSAIATTATSIWASPRQNLSKGFPTKSD